MTSQQLQIAKIAVKQSSVHNWGVFAGQVFYAGDIIEECHTLVCTGADDALHNHYFAGDDGDAFVLPLGYGAIYNHADQPNAELYYNAERKMMICIARDKINIGQEIFISYGEDWFALRKRKAKKTSRIGTMRNIFQLWFRFLSIAVSGFLVIILIRQGFLPFKFF